MTQIINSFFSRGNNSTVQLSRGTNLSYQSTGTAIYTSTTIDSWHVGDFISAEYIINAEYGLNERETIHATLVAMPGQSTITVYGRTSLTRSLLNVRSVSNNSQAQLVVEPATTAVQGTIVTFFANYAKTSQLIRPMNAAATATGAFWSVTNTATTLSISIPTANIAGNILVGQRVSGPGIPSLATVQSWTPLTQQAGVGRLVVGGFFSTNISPNTSATLAFNTSVKQLNNLTNIIEPVRSISSIIVPGQTTIDATVADDYINLKAENGIKITTSQADRSIVIKNQGITQVSVLGQNDINPAVSFGSTTLNVFAGDHITLTTDSTKNRLTIINNGQTLTTDDVVTKTQTTNIIAGANGITTSQTGTNTLTITNNVSVYNKLYGDTNPLAGYSSATSIASTFRILGTAASYSGPGGRVPGISTQVVSQDPTYGDYVQIVNTGVLGLYNGTSLTTGTAGNIQPSDIINTINSQQTVLSSTIAAPTTNPGLQPGLTMAAMMFFMSAHI